MSQTVKQGKISNFKLPIFRKWPGEELRQVEVRFSTWKGLDKQAEHTYLTIEEEHNPIWDEEHNVWRICDDDEKGKGFSADLTFEKEEDAKDIADYICKKLFPENTHKVLYGGRKYTSPLVTPKFYKREGD